MTEQECVIRLLHWIGGLECELARHRIPGRNSDEVDKQRSHAFVKAEIEKLEADLAGIRYKIDKLKSKLQ